MATSEDVGSSKQHFELPIPEAPEPPSEASTLETTPESPTPTTTPEAQATAPEAPDSKEEIPKSPSYTPQCGHPTVTRIFAGPHYACEGCGKPGQWGWLYRCTHDREDMIEHYHKLGIFRIGFDDIGDSLVDQFMGKGPRKGTAAARENELSFLEEITPEQLQTYHPDQVARILEQRSHVKQTATKYREENPWAPPRVPPPPGIVIQCELEKARDRKPWVPPDVHECQYKACARCKPSFKERSFLSLNAVVNGDIPPTAASGFGYHLLRQRPVADANVARNLGLRQPESPRTREAARHRKEQQARETALVKIRKSLAARMAYHHHIRLRGVIPMPLQQTNPATDKAGKGVDDTQTLNKAARTPLPEPTMYETLFFEDKTTDMIALEDEEGVFYPTPLEVDHGIAVTEEAVAEGIADVASWA